MICLRDSSGEIRNASVSLLAVDGAEFKLLCPNSETVERIVTAFLDGLRRRSRWAIALDQSTVPVQGLLSAAHTITVFRPGAYSTAHQSNRPDHWDGLTTFIVIQ